MLPLLIPIPTFLSATVKVSEGFRIVLWRPDYADSDIYTIVDGIKKYTEFDFRARSLMVSSEKYDNEIKGILPVIVVADDYVPESIFTFQIVNEVYWIGVPGISVKIMTERYRILMI